MLALRRGRCFALFGGFLVGPQLQAFRQLSHASFLYKLTVGRVKLNFLKMKKSMFTAFVVGLGLTANVMSQVPSYVPSNGLVGWWPFNANANDESGNGNNGTVNGATLTTDRFGVANKAYNFDGVNDYINNGNNSSLELNHFTISLWSNLDSSLNWNIEPNGGGFFVHKGCDNPNSPFDGWSYRIFYALPWGLTVDQYTNNRGVIESNISSLFNQWNNLIFSYDGSQLKLYLNGIAIDSVSRNGNTATNNFDLLFGCRKEIINNISTLNDYFTGQLDDIGIWNRALTQQEITALNSGCGNEITSHPTNSVNSVGTNAQFSANAPAGSTFQWQNNPLNNGWINLSNNSTYSGVTSNTLNVSNTTISNHNQPFRAIVNSGGCIDTSNVAQIIIGDTCLTTVTDTLIINTTLGLPAPNNENTILIYPNPASDHITIDNGNYTAMAAYTIKIENNAGQQVFQSLINQAQFYVDLSTWSGNGLYFVHLIDAQGNTVTVRKIVLQ
jgi:hypothetical protein